MAAPVFLLFWVLIWDLGIMQSAKLALVADNRSAAFLQSYQQYCLPTRNWQVALSDKTTTFPSSCSAETWEGHANFWRRLEDAGRENLTMDLARAEGPDLVTARTATNFRFHPAFGWPVYEIADSFTVLEARYYHIGDPGFEGGYDATLQRRLGSGHGSLLDLFPNLFPGARK